MIFYWLTYDTQRQEVLRNPCQKIRSKEQRKVFFFFFFFWELFSLLLDISQVWQVRVVFCSSKIIESTLREIYSGQWRKIYRNTILKLSMKTSFHWNTRFPRYSLVLGSKMLCIWITKLRIESPGLVHK